MLPLFSKALAQAESAAAAAPPIKSLRPPPSSALGPSSTAAAPPLDDSTLNDYDADLPAPVPPMSRADRLRAELIANVPEQKSKYVEQLMQVAKKRKLAQEKAYERKFLKEQEEEEQISGPATEKFVTQGYEARLEERRTMLEAEAREDAKPRNVLDFRNAMLNTVVGGATPSSSSVAPSLASPASAASRPSSKPVYVDPSVLKRRQEQRKLSRRAPPSRLTQQDIDRARAIIEQRQQSAWL